MAGDADEGLDSRVFLPFVFFPSSSSFILVASSPLIVATKSDLVVSFAIEVLRSVVTCRMNPNLTDA